MNVEYILLDNIKYEDVEQYAVHLPEDRQKKIKRCRFEEDKLRSLLAGLLIRRVIGDKPMTYGEYGKPYAADGSLFFSVSHSGNMVAIAYGDTELGLDVEALPDESRLKIADRFFHPNEREYVVKSEDKQKAFTEIWTRMEAFLKCTGNGISSDLSAFDTTSEDLYDCIVTNFIEEYAVSVCTVHHITDKDVHISKLELNELLP